jgi:hypothetical protein
MLIGSRSRPGEQMDPWQAFVAFSIGMGLSAACGFRIFLPPLILSLAARFEWVGLGADMLWLGDTWVTAILAVATLVEIGAYYIPWLDNLLDTIATPAAVVAGSSVMAASLDGMHPALQWSLAIIAGGGASGTMQIGTVATRALSTATTGGLANPVVSTGEAGACLVCSLLAVFLPFLALVVVTGLLGLAVMLLVRWRRRRRERGGSERDSLPPEGLFVM